MTERIGRNIAFVSGISAQEAQGDDPAARARALGWTVQRYDNPADGRQALPDLLLIDARGPLDPAMPDGAAYGAGACLALIGRGPEREERIAALLDAGITHLLHWPAGDEDYALALDAACAQAMRHREGRVAGPKDRREQAAPLDGLTGLVGREMARQRLADRLASPDKPPIAACLLIGISQFDSINAAYGKVVGDAVLVQIARRISRCVDEAAGEDALIARMGGTEYLVALPQASGPQASALQPAGEAMARDIARLILTDVARPFLADDNVIRLTARCGIAEPGAGDDVARLLRRASAALADARRSGASDIWFRSGIRQTGKGAGDPDRLDADLRLALDRDEICIVYQPQYDSHKDQIIGVEALARWNHPKLGQLDAGTLFAAADRSDYMVPLSLHIQRMALMEAGQWPEALRDLRLSINITSADLAQEDFSARLFDLVAQSGFPPERLTVEITESGLIENIDRAAQILQYLRGRGLRVAIDDFGTGYSSLAYLKALYPDYLKIDHGLSRDILGTSRDRIILRAIIAMARSLALTVIAEGVESEEQLTLLAREGCEIYQGFLRSPAISSAQLQDMMLQAQA
ncbi:MAG: putative bifunctional diguanylate cyclase/phosphodiesterase [Sphingobium sp.]